MPELNSKNMDLVRHNASFLLWRLPVEFKREVERSVERPNAAVLMHYASIMELLGRLNYQDVSLEELKVIHVETSLLPVHSLPYADFGVTDCWQHLREAIAAETGLPLSPETEVSFDAHY